MSSAFAAACRRNPDGDFLHVLCTADRSDHETRLTYASAAERVRTLRERYTGAGYYAGQRVALALDNRAEFFLHFIALDGLGISIVPVNPGVDAKQLRFVVEHSRAAAIVAHEQHFAAVRGAWAGVDGFGLQSSRELELRAPAGGAVAAPGETALLYTSGTTGVPKGCVLDAAYFDCVAQRYTNLGGYVQFDAADRLLTPLPVTHMNALACSFMAMLSVAGCLVQLDRFHPRSWWDAVDSTRATCFHYLGVMPAMLLQAPPSARDPRRSRLRFGFGAGVDPGHHEAFEARFGVRLIEAWSMTETGGGAWIAAATEPRHVGTRCIGRAPQDVEYLLVGESGEAVTPGTPGELLVRRAGTNPRRGFFAGYYDDTAATEEAWRDGWFHTGDVVRQGSDGSLHFVDRLKNIVRRSGENIAAVEVESVLERANGVEACAVTPVPDDIRGEEVFAFVVTRIGTDGDEECARALQAACLRELAYFKAPGYVAFVHEIPRTASQKIARGEVKQLAASMLAEGRVFDLRSLKKRLR